MELPDILCLGESMILVTPTEPTSLEDAQLFQLSVGGAESTVAMYLADLGFRTSWVSIVGRDPLGVRMTRYLERQLVDTTFVQFSEDAPTGVYFKSPDGGVTRVLYYRKGSAASTMGIQILDAIPLATARLVHASGITPGLSPECMEMMLALPTRLRAAGTPFSFDVNYRPGVWSVEEAGPVLLELARQAEYVFVGRDEASVLWGTGDARSVYDFIRPTGKLIVKDGAVGATEFSDTGTAFVPAPRIDVVEEVGAGDAFAAGYLAAQLNGDDTQVALSAGHQLAARTLQSTSDFVPLERA